FLAIPAHLDRRAPRGGDLVPLARAGQLAHRGPHSRGRPLRPSLSAAAAAANQRPPGRARSGVRMAARDARARRLLSGAASAAPAGALVALVCPIRPSGARLRRSGGDRVALAPRPPRSSRRPLSAALSGGAGRMSFLPPAPEPEAVPARRVALGV